MNRVFNTVRIDRAALRHNLGEVRRLVGPNVGIMAAVKADAYGHGLKDTAETLARAGADALGVMNLDEALQLRETLPGIPIYILAGISPDQCEEIAARDLIPFIYDPGLAREMDAAGKKAGKKARIQLKIDTGMNRLGVPADRAEGFLEEVAALEHVEVTGLVTHFSTADSLEREFTGEQLARFSRVLDLAGRMGVRPVLNSAANSAGVMGHEKAYFQMVRPGIMLYGAYPEYHLKEKADLKPVMSLTSRVLQVKQAAPGETVSYGRTWTALRETRLATVPLGYAHGYNRLLSNHGWALIRGRTAPLRGRVCMNLTVFDVTHIPEAAPGDEVVLLGAQGDQRITAEDMAEVIGTINYEIFCQIGGLNRREYYDSEQET